MEFFAWHRHKLHNKKKKFHFITDIDNLAYVCLEGSKNSFVKKMTSLHLKSWEREMKKFAHTRNFLSPSSCRPTSMIEWILCGGIIMNNSKSVTMKILQTLLTHKKKVEEDFKKEPKAAASAASIFFCINSTESEQKTLKFMPLISISWLKASLSLIAIKIN